MFKLFNFGSTFKKPCRWQQNKNLNIQLLFFSHIPSYLIYTLLGYFISRLKIVDYSNSNN